jgi:hypothetical protein
LTTATDLGILKVDIPSQYFLTVTGTITDCSGTPVTNGAAFINFDGTSRYAATNAQGQFTTDFIVCSNPPVISVIGFDNTTQQQGSLQIITPTLPVTNVANLVACGSSSAEYIQFTLDGSNYSLTSNSGNSSIFGTTQSSVTNLTGYTGPVVTGNGSVDLYVNATDTGTFNVTSFSYINAYTDIKLEQPFDITFITFPQVVGGFYEGSFSGSFSADSFRIRRNQ